MKTVNKEPDFKTEKREWLIWNMITYNNNAQEAFKILRQKEILAGF